MTFDLFIGHFIAPQSYIGVCHLKWKHRAKSLCDFTSTFYTCLPLVLPTEQRTGVSGSLVFKMLPFSPWRFPLYDKIDGCLLLPFSLFKLTSSVISDVKPIIHIYISITTEDNYTQKMKQAHCNMSGMANIISSISPQLDQ